MNVFSSPQERQSNSFPLCVGFQQREGQRIETEKSFVNFDQLAHRGRGSRGKECPFVDLANCTAKTDRLKSPMYKVSVTETEEAEN